MKVLVTGAAGFIGYHLTERLLKDGHEVVGLDSLNDYYTVELKHDRLRQLGIAIGQQHSENLLQSSQYPGFQFIQLKLEEREPLQQLFVQFAFDAVVNLAAQAGVRYSITHPYNYIDANIVGFMNILECCRHHNIGHLVYASSSSVYGLNESIPFRPDQPADHPVSLYAASKKANEMMAHVYSHLYKIPTTGLRFFTVYGPWGRPDMALSLFTKAIIDNKPIDVFNHGNMERDFTYVGDIVEGVVRVLQHPAQPNPDWDARQPASDSSTAPYRLYNIGHNAPVKLTAYIEAIEKKLGKKAIKNMLPIQPGDVPRTFADVSSLMNDVGYRPTTTIEEGVGYFIDWYLQYHHISLS